MNKIIAGLGWLVAFLDNVLKALCGINDPVGIKGHVLVELFGPDGELKYRGETTNKVTDQGDILFASLAYTAAPTFNMKLGTAATAVSKTKANAGAYIASAHGSNDYVAGSQLGMDSTYPKAGTSTPGSGSQVVFKRTWAAGVATDTLNRVALVDSTETTDPSDGTLTYAIALLPDAPVVKGSGDTLSVTWTITHLGG
jgi:hypothetical protein